MTSPHLSDLELDGIDPGAPAPSHLAACAQCSDRRASLQREDRLAREQPGFTRARAVVLSARAVQGGVTRRAPLWGLVPALAAVGVAVAVVGAPEVGEWQARRAVGVRLKGSVSVEVVRLADRAVNPVLVEGDQVALRLSPGRHRYARVAGIDALGRVSQLWPPEQASGQLSGDGMLPVFRATAGNLALHAFFSDQPLSADLVERELTPLKTACLRELDGALCLVIPALPPGADHAAVALVVEEAP